MVKFLVNPIPQEHPPQSDPFNLMLSNAALEYQDLLGITSAFQVFHIHLLHKGPLAPTALASGKLTDSPKDAHD